jgi:hypothetical protein
MSDVIFSDAMGALLGAISHDNPSIIFSVDVGNIVDLLRRMPGPIIIYDYHILLNNYQRLSDIIHKHGIPAMVEKVTDIDALREQHPDTRFSYLIANSLINDQTKAIWFRLSV